MLKIKHFKKSERFIGLSLINRIAGFVVFVAAKMSGRLSSQLQLAGDVANYSDWLKLHFGDPKRFFNREGLFGYLVDKELGNDVIVFEFGVAKGYLTQWVLRRDRKHRIMTWHGYDTFEGLPESWRNYQAGAFSNNGETPSIDDPRITWHIGFAEERIKEINLDSLTKQPLLLIFDLDLEQPTRDVLKYLAGSIKPGDLIYFDEAFDYGERQVIMDYVIPKFELEVLGTTPLAILFRVANILD